jgi:hypothetical protein
VRVLELGSYVIPAYGGMILAEQGHAVEKWISPTTDDPVLGLKRGGELWSWLNAGKSVHPEPADHVTELEVGEFDVIIDNIRASTWKRWGVDPAEVAARLHIPWIAMRDDFDGRSFDAIAQARAWGDHLGYLPIYIGDTTGGLWLALKALSTVSQGQAGLHILRQAACLAKLVEGELVVEADRYGSIPPWDSPGTYGSVGSAARVEFKGETVMEPMRGPLWRRQNLRHQNGRYVV